MFRRVIVHLFCVQQVGFDVVVDTISDMVSRAKKDAGVDPNTPLITLVSRSQIVTHSLPKLYTKIKMLLSWVSFAPLVATSMT